MKHSTTTPDKVAEDYGVSIDKVLEWINSGELFAVDFAATGSVGPKWRIPLSALAAFNASDRKPFPDSIPPLDNNSIPAGVTPIESEGDANPIGYAMDFSWFGKESGQFPVVRSKPFMQFDPENPDYPVNSEENKQ
jgi:hypothetical protein